MARLLKKVEAQINAAFIEAKKWQYREIYSVLPQAKTYVSSFKKTTNPNVSPIGKRFGFECFGAGGGTRTHTPLLTTDFESVSSANSDTPALNDYIL